MEHSRSSRQNIEQASRIILESQYTVALVGAGMSVESGIPPFRGPGGLWTRYGEPTMLGFQKFLQDPAAWWEENLREQDQGARGEMKRAIENAAPNPGHYALVDLERMGFLRRIITQNVDNLHYVAGSRMVAEIHGNRTLLRCLSCNLRLPRVDFPIDEGELPPRCPECGGTIKGDGVMFGEPIPSDVLQVCYEESHRADCMLILGTSALVYPAASFPSLVKSQGGRLIEVNLYETSLTWECDVVLRGPSGEILPRIVECIRELQEAEEQQ